MEDEIQCHLCGKPGKIYWAPWYIDPDGELQKAGEGCYGTPVLCASHFESLFTLVKSWVQGIADEMVERAAQAIYEQNDPGGWTEIGNESRDVARYQARAALEEAFGRHE